MSGHPEQFGPYALLGLLGAGPTGDVFRAAHTKGAGQGQPLALKRFHLPFSRDPGFRASFFAGVEAARRVDHPRVSPILDVGEVGGLLYVVRPLIAGSSLRALLDHIKAVGGVVPPGLAIGCVLQLADALRGIQAIRLKEGPGAGGPLVHGSLKPDNILIDAQGGCAVLDLGTSGPIAWGSAGLWWLDPSALPYLPPESLGGRRPELQFDVFSLGALLVELLTLSPPHSFGTPIEAIDALRRLDLVPLRTRLLDQGFERELIDLIEWALDPDAGRRLEDGSLFFTYLNEQAPGHTTGPGPEVFWGELLTELQGLEEEAPPPADGVWDLLLLGGLPAEPSGRVDALSVALGARGEGGDEAEVGHTNGAPETLGWGRRAALPLGATPVASGAGEPADGEGPSQGIVLDALFLAVAGLESPEDAPAPATDAIAPRSALGAGGAAAEALVEQPPRRVSREEAASTALSLESAVEYDADQLAYGTGDEDDEDFEPYEAEEPEDDFEGDDEGDDPVSDGAGAPLSAEIFAAGDGEGEDAFVLAAEGDPFDDSQDEDDDDDAPPVLVVPGAPAEEGAIFAAGDGYDEEGEGDDESEAEEDAFEAAERAFFASGSAEAEHLILEAPALAAAPEEAEDEAFEVGADDEGDDEYGDEYEDDDDDDYLPAGDSEEGDDAPELMITLGEGGASARRGGVLGVGERVDLSAILGGDKPEVIELAVGPAEEGEAAEIFVAGAEEGEALAAEDAEAEGEGDSEAILAAGAFEGDDADEGEDADDAEGDDGEGDDFEREGEEEEADAADGHALAQDRAEGDAAGEIVAAQGSEGEPAAAARRGGQGGGQAGLVVSVGDLETGTPGEVAVDDADLPEAVMLPTEAPRPRSLPGMTTQEQSSFESRQTVQMSQEQIRSLLASGDRDTLSERQREVLESLQSLDGEATPLGLSDILSAFNRPSDGPSGAALPQVGGEAETANGDSEAARLEALLQTGTRRRRSGALPEGTVLEGQLKIVRRIEVGPHRALYEALPAPESLTRRCWDCGYAHNTRDDRRCYRCRRPLGQRRFCVSARWDKRLVGYELGLLRKEIAHPCLDPIYGWLVHEGQLCRVMELRGDELLAMLGQVEPAQAHAIALSLCDALTYLSAQGVTLRELLPSQVVVTEGGALLYDPEVGGVDEGPLKGADLSRAAELIGRLLVLLLPSGASPLGGLLSEATAGRFSSPEGFKGALLALEERGRSIHGA